MGTTRSRPPLATQRALLGDDVLVSRGIAIDTGDVVLPVKLELDGEFIRFRPAPETKGLPKPVPRDLLWRFMTLVDAPDRRVADFAGRYGALGVCYGHGLPRYHSSRQRVVADLTYPGASTDPIGPCTPQELTQWLEPGWEAELVQDWRLWAQRFRTFFEQVVELQNGRQPRRPLDLEFLRGFTSAPAESRWTGKFSIARGWHEVQMVVNGWLADNRLRPHLFADAKRREVRVRASTGRAIELLVLHAMNFTVAGEPTYKCQAEDCGRFYAAMRKPASGRKNFCPSCGRRASNRYSARARRATAL